MSWFSDTVQWGRSLVANSVPISEIRPGSAVWDSFVGSTGPANLPAVTEQSAQQITAVNACVNLISGAIAGLPVNLFTQDRDGQRSKLTNDDIWWLLNEEFAPRWVAHAGWDYLSRSRLFHGDAFAVIRRAGARIVTIDPKHPRNVEVIPYQDGSRLVYRVWPEPWEKNRAAEIIDQDDMLHVPGWGFDGIRSLSPLRHALRMAGGVALATQDFSAQFFANQARPDYVLSTDATLKTEQLEELRQQVTERHSRASGNASRPMLLQGGMKVQAVSLSNEDAELIATRGFQIEEIARAYGVPPHMIGRSEKTTSWGSGISEMGSGFVRYTLRSHLNAFQNEINRKFFRMPGKVAEFDTFELERGDMKGMFEAYRIALGRAGEPGFLTRDEVRERLYMNRTDGGDQFNSGETPNVQPAA